MLSRLVVLDYLEQIFCLETWYDVKSEKLLLLQSVASLVWNIEKVISWTADKNPIDT